MIIIEIIYYFHFQVDVDDNEELSSIYNISSMPTFAFFKDSKQVDSFSGANPGKLEEYIAKYSA